MRVFFGFSIGSEASVENVKKTLSLAGGKRKENVEKTSRNRISQEAQKSYSRQTHVSYIESLPKSIKFNDFGGSCAPGPGWTRKRTENVKKTYRKRKENVKKTLRKNVKKTLRKT